MPRHSGNNERADSLRPIRRGRTQLQEIPQVVVVDLSPQGTLYLEGTAEISPQRELGKRVFA